MQSKLFGDYCGHILILRYIYTFIYGVDVNKDSSDCIIEYDDNRRKNRTWHIPMKNNKFIMFPATNKYSFSPNTSDGLNIILTNKS